MNVILIDQTNNEFIAEINIARKKELSTLKEWNFNWAELHSKKGKIYRLKLKSEIVGLIKLEWQNEEHFTLANIELSPINIGSKGKFSNAAEILFAYSALMSFKLNKGAYKGFLAFKSKGRLIQHYTNKYNAELVFRDRMIISPTNCRILIKQHLKLEI